MTATVTPLPQPTCPRPDPASVVALAELVQLGLAVARAASHLAQAETDALAALTEAARHAARLTVAPAHHVEAFQAGQALDVTDLARDGAATRIASITRSFEQAARAVRRTVALQARLADPRPWHRDPAPVPTPPYPAPRRRPANDTDTPDRADAPENGNELGTLSDDQVRAGIQRDLLAATGRLPADATRHHPPVAAPAGRPPAGAARASAPPPHPAPPPTPAPARPPLSGDPPPTPDG